MTQHPEHLLAELVEDRLDAAARAEAEAHIATCERCRSEVRLAREGRDALSGLGDLEPPAGLPLAIRRDVRRAPRRSWRTAGIAAAAAGIIAAGAVAITVISGDDAAVRRTTEGEGQREPGAPEQEPQAGAPEAGRAPGGAFDAGAAPVPMFRATNQRYSQDSLPRLGRRFRDEARAALEQGFPPTTTAFFEAFELDQLGPAARRAYRCVLAEVPPAQPLAPLAVEGASFEGTPAYVAAFLQGPGPDRPYDRVVIWVVGRESCSLLSLAGQRLE